MASGALSKPWVAGGLVALLCRLPGLAGGLDNDVAIYLTGGFAWSTGDVPYRDLFDHKGPLNPELFLALDWLLPTSTLALRLALLAAVVLSLFHLSALIGRHAPGAAWPATVIYAIAVSSPLFQGHDANTEQWALVLAIPAADLADRARLAGGRSAVALAAGTGALIVAAASLKSIYLVCAAPVPLLLLGREPNRLFACAAGGGAALCLILLPYALAGVLGDVHEAVLSYSREFADTNARAILAGGPGEVLEYLTEYPDLLLPGLALPLGVFAYWCGGRRDAVLIAVLATVAGWAAARLPGQSYAHYFLLTLPGLAVLCGLGVEALAPRVRAPSGLVAALVIVPVGVVLGLGPIRDALLIPPEQRWGVTRLPCLGAQDEAAAVVRKITAPEDRIYVATGDSLNYFGQQIYWRARRRAASRYIFPANVVPPAYDLVADDLRRSSPEAIVVMPGAETAGVGEAIRAGGLERRATVPCADGLAIDVLAERPAASTRR